MQKRTVNGNPVGAIGLGCMGMTWAYGENGERREHIEVIHRAIEIGATLIDTADAYGPFTNEELVGAALRDRREQAFLATKVGLVLGPGPLEVRRNARPEHIRASIDASLQRLGTDHVDLYQLHRVDPEVPLEESWGAMAEAVKAGKAKAIGLSEVTLDELARAGALHPVASVQSELSLWTRDHLEVARHCAANGIAFLAYSPLGRGFLTGSITKTADLQDGDWRRTNPRFADDAIAKNLALVEQVKAMAATRGVTPAQIALAWTLAQGSSVIPIPGTRRQARLEENCGAAAITLQQDELAQLDALPAAHGTRY